ncbi:unnamed protein product [Durusdinium trenchii]|uniref:Uncharacterized protein n=1 Tax=Durusdinium trenchii TaxID=1381693 RepID=A0ABP0R6G3_9DINO
MSTNDDQISSDLETFADDDDALYRREKDCDSDSFGRQTSIDTSFMIQVDVIVAVPESASRMAFETYIERAGLEDSVLALDEKELADALLEAQGGDPENPLLVLVGEDSYLDDIRKLHLQVRRPFLVLASGNCRSNCHYLLPASCGQASFTEALRHCVAWSMSKRVSELTGRVRTYV